MRYAPTCMLLALAGCGSPSGTDADDPLPVVSALFREAAAACGLDFHHFPDASDEFRLPEIMGSGVALLDYDQDGDLDVYLLQGASLEPGVDPNAGKSPPRHALGSRLFENRIVPDGALSFADRTQRVGLTFDGYAMGAAVGDYDADGDPDLYVTALGENALFRNNGNGTFARIDGPQDRRWSTSASFVDYDQDGDLDLFLANYIDFTVRNNKPCFSPVGARDYCSPTVYNPVPDRLFRNDDGRFTDVSAEAGLGTAFGNGLGVASVDLNNDGRPDIYVANDGTENQLWINQGAGRFENGAMLSGAAVNADGRAEAGMGVVAADFDNDGDDDLFLTHNTLETNTLYLNNGRGLFLDATNRLGLGSHSMPFTGFGLSWADFDHDGWLDLFIANGAVTVMEAQRGDTYPFVQDDQFFRGTENGFEVLRGANVWGELMPLVGRGMATGDIDGDGDVDLVVSNNNGPARLYLNQTDDDRWLRVRLHGAGQNPYAIGARVGLRFADGATHWRRIRRDGSYLSSNEPVAHFGLGHGQQVASVTVRWPDGHDESFPAPGAGRTITLRQGSGRATPQ